MRADRAYIAGFGTTGVLVASALLLLAVVSTLVAFRGWPGTDVAEDIGNLIVEESERPLAVEGPRRIAREAAPAAGAVADTPAPGTDAAAGAPAASTVPGPRPRPQAIVPPRERVSFRDGRLEQGSTAQPLPNGLSDQPQSPVSLLPETPVSAGLERVTSGLGDATQGLTDGLGQTVGGLSPPLGETLIDTGRLLADLLRALGQPRR